MKLFKRILGWTIFIGFVPVAGIICGVPILEIITTMAITAALMVGAFFVAWLLGSD